MLRTMDFSVYDTAFRLRVIQSQEYFIMVRGGGEKTLKRK